MKKKFTVLATLAAALCMSVALMAGCSSDEPAGGDAPADGEEAMTLVVGFDAGYPPYGYIADDGSYVGLDLDLAAEVCERNGWALETTPIDWDAKDALLNDGSITCVWNGFTYEGREDLYAWTEPYMLNAQVMVVKADSGIASLEDLAGKNVITQVESAALDVLEAEENAALVASFANGAVQTIATYNDAFMQLETGLVDAVACDLSIAAFQMAANPDVYTQIAELSAEHYAVGFKLGNEDLAAQVTATLKEMVADGTAQQICEKYADQGITWEGWCLK
ncbi:MAG: transporter substrate-binding domain-containing protein [Eggerthellaceae bacterium]|nr:transporter substrate-binding domain-containing protein [Eggerthellaceae bacterium]